MNELSCNTFHDIRNDFKKLDVITMITEHDYITGSNRRLWEIGRFSMKTKAVCGKNLINSQKLNGESTRNILLNDDV